MSTADDDDFMKTIATAAICFAATISFLQLDSVSRHILSAESLRSRRRQEVTYRIEKGIENDVLANNTRMEISIEDEAAHFIHTESEIDNLITVLLDPDKKDAKVKILSMDLDKNDERVKREYFLFLGIKMYEGEEDKWEKVQVPLIPFCSKLASRFEERLTSTAMCFVADASSGLLSDLLMSVLEDSELGVAVVKAPTWMMALANLIEKRAILAKDKMEQIIFALCRLEAWLVRDHVGSSKTVLFLLPGQSFTPPLLPLLQKCFPCERHIFAYDTCQNSLTLALSSRKTRLQTSSPISPLRSLRNLSPKLKHLSSTQAHFVEAWMASVDSFLQLKEDEAKNGYLPYVLRMGFLMGSTDVIGHGSNDQSELALTNVLQFITGTRSRPLKDEALKPAIEALHLFRKNHPKYGTKLAPSDRSRLEDCVFLHKGILIGDKTLLDTVQPNQEWTLKSAKKINSCACCAPEDDDDDEEENQNDLPGIEESIPGSSGYNNISTGLTRRRPNYVDGKAKFAFDPAAFAKR